MKQFFLDVKMLHCSVTAVGVRGCKTDIQTVLSLVSWFSLPLSKYSHLICFYGRKVGVGMSLLYSSCLTKVAEYLSLPPKSCWCLSMALVHWRPMNSDENEVFQDFCMRAYWNDDVYVCHMPWKTLTCSNNHPSLSLEEYLVSPREGEALRIVWLYATSLLLSSLSLILC